MCNVNIEEKVLSEIQDSNKQLLTILDEHLEESVENEIEMGLALFDTRVSVDNLDTVQVK
jgi:c-di-AMP phosphodiesterase-like protein